MVVNLYTSGDIFFYLNEYTSAFFDYLLLGGISGLPLVAHQPTG